MIPAMTLLLAAVSLQPVNEGSYRSVVAGNRGKVVVVNFWATWCHGCRHEMPALLEFQKNHPAVKLVLVSADEPTDEAKARAFLESVNASGSEYIKKAKDDDAFISAIDPKWTGTLPATFVYDRQGKLVKSFNGEVKMDQLESVVKRL